MISGIAGGTGFGSEDSCPHLPVEVEEVAELGRIGAGGTILQFVRHDGVITKFDKSKGYFGAYNPDGTIRTFFIPNDGERYFRRQARR